MMSGALWLAVGVCAVLMGCAGYRRRTVPLRQRNGDAHRKQLEYGMDVKRLTHELHRLAAFQDELLATVGHQLMTPLTAITQGIDLLRDGAARAPRDRQAVIDTMAQEVARLVRLAEEALDLSVLQSGYHQLARQPGDLAALLRSAQQQWQAVAGSAHAIRLVCHDLPPVFMDAEAVRGVVDHLLRNALRHAPAESDVLMQAGVRGEMARVGVRDHGPGLSTEQLGRLFQPFTHLQAPYAPGSQGSGLGLAFCREVLERHRGRIHAQPNTDRGITVWFELPLASPRFLLEDAFLSARDDTDQQAGPFGLILVTPAGDAPAEAGERGLRRAEGLLRNSTHRGDRFVQVDERALVIFAVADRAGLEAMLSRLERVLDHAGVAVSCGLSVFPEDGRAVDVLLEAARARREPPAELVDAPRGAAWRKSAS